MKNTLMIGIAAVAVVAAVLGLGGRRERLLINQTTYSPYERR